MVAIAASVQREFFFKEDGRKNDLGPFDAKVFSVMKHGWFPYGVSPVRGTTPAGDQSTL